MADKRISDLNALTTLADADLLVVSDASSSETKKATFQNFKNSIAAGGTLTDIVQDTTPQLGGSLDVNGEDIVSTSNGNITLTPNGSGVVRIDGSSGIDMQSVSISIKNSGTQSYVDFYCESSNAHYARLQAPAHSAFSGNITLTLPATTDTVAGIAATQAFTNKTITNSNNTVGIATLDIDGGTDIGGALADADLLIVDDGAGGTNRKATLTRLKTYLTSAGFSSDDPTALAIALG